MRPEIEYKREMNRNYIVLRAGEPEGEPYTTRMLSENRIDGVLPFHEKYIDGERWYYYDITSRQPLHRMLETRCISGEEIRQLISGILFSVRQIERFLLDESQVSFEPQLIYVEPDSLKSGLCLIPGRKMDFAKGFYALSQYLLEHVDHNDSEAVVLAFGIMKESGKENFGVEDIERCIGKLAGGEGNIKRQSMAGNKNAVESQGMGSHTGTGGYTGRGWEEGPAEMDAGEKHHNHIKATWILAFFMVLLPLVLYLRMGMLGFLKYKWILGAVELLLGAAAFLLSDMGKGQKEPGEKKEEMDRQADRDWEIIFREKDSMGEILPQESYQSSPKRETAVTELPSEDEEDAMQTILLTAPIPSRASRRLVPVREGEEIELGYFPFLIGKSGELTDYCLDRPEVSRLHLRIDEAEGGCMVTDLNSTNGTKVDGHLLAANETYLLPPDGMLEIAGIQFRFITRL